MSQTATSPAYPHPSPRPTRPTATSASRQNSSAALPTSSKMPPLMSPRISAPQQSAHTPKTPSPNYFGFHNNDSNAFLTDSSPHHAKKNWSPPSSAVRSTAAISPSVIPVDQRSEYDAFRKQSEGKAFNLGALSDFKMNPPPFPRPYAERTKSRTSPKGADGAALNTVFKSDDRTNSGLLEVSSSPKRMLSPGSLTYPEHPRRSSPANSEPPRQSRDSSPDRHPRVKLPLDSNPSARHVVPKTARAETLPLANATDDQFFVTPQHIVNLLDSGDEELLVLDLRVSTQYATSHINGALNLCIPTTLLKRPSFNVQKLGDTFKDETQRARFERWRVSKYIVVYDNASSQLKDAAICVNTIKKFQTEGYNGTLCIIKGGFVDFASRFPALVGTRDRVGSTGSDQGLSDSEGPEVAPVAGGCPMPFTENSANPFFGNIRQNMDLIGGVGQIAIKHPPRATADMEKYEYPAWLKRASEDSDQGQHVSKRFEQIEQREKKRMEDALSGKVSYGATPKAETAQKVRIAGIEKGAKNRYNNIWPFEHSRVKLQGVPTSGCDYFNANHIKAALSHKRYISTQAPIPATFTDFWNVVWQQDVRVVVMLTAEKEGAQVKAHNYWSKKQYGSLHLDFLSEKRASLDANRIMRHKYRPSAVKSWSSNSVLPKAAPTDAKDERTGEQPFVLVRKFTLSHENFPFERMREITQLQYSSWPDFGAPADPAHLIGLVEQCDSVVRSINKAPSGEPAPANNRPVLVHCSAGCGRTGTFCTVDAVIDMLKRQRNSKRKRTEISSMDVEQRKSSKKDSPVGFFDPPSVQSSENIPDGNWINRDDLDLVEKTVEDFRHQRLSMVQSLRQYVLCYESIMEWIIDRVVEQGSEPVSTE